MRHGEASRGWLPSYLSDSDAQLFVRARAGDSAALSALCSRNWRPVYRSFARFTFDPGEAEDLTQEVFVRALRALPRFEERGVPFVAYLLRIAENLARDRGRVRVSRPAEVRGMPELPGNSPDPEAMAIESGLRSALLAALDAISADHRKVLRLRVLEGRTAEEAAAELGRSAQAVRQLQVRALEALRRELAAGDYPAITSKEESEA